MQLSARREQAQRTIEQFYEDAKDELTLLREDEVLDAVAAFHFSEKETREEKAHLVRQIEQFIIHLTREWQREIWPYIYKDPRISKKMRAYIKEHGLDLPTFHVYTADAADEYLDAVLPGAHLNENDNFLVVFNLPKPLAQYWKKGDSEEWEDDSSDMRGMVVEWRKLYREMIPYVWGQLQDQQDYEGLHIRRINDIHVHSPKDFYYIWEFSDKPFEQSE
jgi:hypothetical protein